MPGRPCRHAGAWRTSGEEDEDAGARGIQRTEGTSVVRARKPTHGCREGRQGVPVSASSSGSRDEAAAAPPPGICSVISDNALRLQPCFGASVPILYNTRARIDLLQWRAYVWLAVEEQPGETGGDLAYLSRGPSPSIQPRRPRATSSMNADHRCRETTLCSCCTITSANTQHRRTYPVQSSLSRAATTRQTDRARSACSADEMDGPQTDGRTSSRPWSAPCHRTTCSPKDPRAGSPHRSRTRRATHQTKYAARV